VPLLVIQGERDPFGAPVEFPAGTHIFAVGGDHSLRGASLPEAVTEAVAWARESAASALRCATTVGLATTPAVDGTPQHT